MKPLCIFLSFVTIGSIASAQFQQRTRPQDYTLDQAISDNAQLHTIAFSGLAFITGDFGACTFVPPGKVCDFFGFQYMRDIDAVGAGHNPKFLDRVAGNVMRILDEGQRKQFVELANEQAPQFEKLARMRLPLIKAFCKELSGDVPTGSTGLNRKAVAKYTGDMFASDGELSYRRAEVFGKVASSLSADQKASFAKMKFGDFSTWPEADERQGLREAGRGKSQLFSVAYMTYASEFFSWYKGSVDADTYFCPERHGTYFGGFYMKDMPAMGKRDPNISMTRTGDSGRDFLSALRPEQRKLLTEIIEKQRPLLTEIVSLRRKISEGLRLFLAERTPSRTEIVQMCRRYGDLDGEMSWLYATAFAGVNKTLTSAQRAVLSKLRDLDGYSSPSYYVYSRAMNDTPDLSKADALFFAPK